MKRWILDVCSPYMRKKNVEYSFIIGENKYCVRQIDLNYNWGSPICNDLLIDDEIEYHRIFDSKEEAIAAAKQLKKLGNGV